MFCNWLLINNGFKVHWFTGTAPFTYNFPISFNAIETSELPLPKGEGYSTEDKIVVTAADGGGGCVWLQDKTLTSVKVNYWNINNQSASKLVSCIGLGF